MRQRLAYFDNLKGFAILLVVLGHCIQSCGTGEHYRFLFNLIYAFHMPLFMAVSGYFGYRSGDINLLSRTKKNVVRLMVPYFAWGGLSLLLFKTSPLQLFISPDSYLWFLWDLFFISFVVNAVLSMFGDKAKPTITIPILAVFSVIILGFGKFLPTNDFNIKSICWMFQFYVAGAAYKVYGEKLKANKFVGILMAALFLILFGAKYAFMPQNGMAAYITSMVIAYLACYACLVLFRSYADNESPLTRLGQSTLGVYAVYQLLIKVCGIDNVWLSFAVVLFLSVSFVYVIRKTQYLKFLIGE